jgi:hypothetical protein
LNLPSRIREKVGSGHGAGSRQLLIGPGSAALSMKEGEKTRGESRQMTRWREATDATSPIGADWSCQMI